MAERIAWLGTKISRKGESLKTHCGLQWKGSLLRKRFDFERKGMLRLFSRVFGRNLMKVKDFYSVSIQDLQFFFCGFRFVFQMFGVSFYLIKSLHLFRRIPRLSSLVLEDIALEATFVNTFPLQSLQQLPFQIFTFALCTMRWRRRRRRPGTLIVVPFFLKILIFPVRPAVY